MLVPGQGLAKQNVKGKGPRESEVFCVWVCALLMSWRASGFPHALLRMSSFVLGWRLSRVSRAGVRPRNVRALHRELLSGFVICIQPRPVHFAA